MFGKFSMKSYSNVIVRGSWIGVGDLGRTSDELRGANMEPVRFPLDVGVMPSSSSLTDLLELDVRHSRVTATRGLRSDSLERSELICAQLTQVNVNVPHIYINDAS